MTIANSDSIKPSIIVGPDILKKSHASDILWVPAEKHPEIAPKEFLKFIESHKNIPPLRRTLSLCRRRSLLSKAYAYESEECEVELNRTLSEKKRDFLKKMQDKQRDPEEVIERNSFFSDDSSTFKSKSERSLSRRSALSARGYSKKSIYKRLEVSKEQHKSINTIESNTQKDLKEYPQTWDKMTGVNLYDPPVNLEEWIDLRFTSQNLESEPQINLTDNLNSTKSKLLNINRPQDTEKGLSWINGLLQERLKSVRMMVNTAQGIVGLTSFLSTRFRTEKPTIDSKPTNDNDRLPLHIERNIYRMSHMKLADPSRDLHDQVLIYNFMYWYLSIQAPTPSSVYTKKKKRPSFISLSKKSF